MFFSKILRRDIMLEPKHLGAKLIDKVKEKITLEVEGQCLGANGYVIQIVDYQNIIPGSIDIDTGAVQVTVLYEAILMRPFKNEVLDAIVTTATNEQMPEEMKFNQASGDCWVSDDGAVEIREGSIVRLRVMNVSVYAHEIEAMATINDPCLGQLS